MYANLMREVKVRLHCIERVLSGAWGEMPPAVASEFGYLQLRLLCELISLSCLAAHGDLSSQFSKRLNEDYSADGILKALEKLRSKFYPVAIEALGVTSWDNIGKYTIKAAEKQPFVKSDLVKLYGDTHQHLHRGGFIGIFHSDRILQPDKHLVTIASWASRIHAHLSLHIIPVRIPRESTENFETIMCRLGALDEKVRVATGLASPIESPP